MPASEPSPAGGLAPSLTATTPVAPSSGTFKALEVASPRAAQLCFAPMLQGLALIFLCQLAGETLVRLLGVPVPGPVAGMVILLLGLVLAGGPGDSLRRAGTGLLGYLTLFFVPAGVGLVTHGPRLAADWLPILVAIVVSTLVTMLLVGWLVGRRAPAERVAGADDDA